MFIKLTRRGPNRYVQLVEAYRDAYTGKPKQRTVASLGRLDQLHTELNSVIAGLQRVTGQTPASTTAAPPILSFGAAHDLFYGADSVQGDAQALQRQQHQDFTRACTGQISPDSASGGQGQRFGAHCGAV